jgi:hypothetical protein
MFLPPLNFVVDMKNASRLGTHFFGCGSVAVSTGFPAAHTPSQSGQKALTAPFVGVIPLITDIPLNGGGQGPTSSQTGRLVAIAPAIASLDGRRAVE